MINMSVSYGLWVSGDSRLIGLCPVFLTVPFASLKPFIIPFESSDKGVWAATEVK